jgi:hypothetical protein
MIGGINNIFDIRLFDFDNTDIKVFNNENNYINNCNYYIKINIPTISSSPYNIYNFIKKFNANITFEEIINNWHTYANEIIKPSKLIKDNIPKNLNNSYGIHLRKTDKINYNNDDITHGIAHGISNGVHITIEDFNLIYSYLLNDICNIILIENEPSFLITSEDNNWKEYFKNELLTFANKNNKTINFINIDYSNIYDNYNAIIDLFCLSKCKKIFQGIKHSTFSLVASIIGNTDIINYSHKLNFHNDCLIHLYNPVITINNSKECNINLINQIFIKDDPIIYNNISI